VQDVILAWQAKHALYQAQHGSLVGGRPVWSPLHSAEKLFAVGRAVLLQGSAVVMPAASCGWLPGVHLMRAMCRTHHQLLTPAATATVACRPARARAAPLPLQRPRPQLPPPLQLQHSMPMRPTASPAGRLHALLPPACSRSCRARSCRRRRACRNRRQLPSSHRQLSSHMLSLGGLQAAACAGDCCACCTGWFVAGASHVFVVVEVMHALYDAHDAGTLCTFVAPTLSAIPGSSSKPHAPTQHEVTRLQVNGWAEASRGRSRVGASPAHGGGWQAHQPGGCGTRAGSPQGSCKVRWPAIFTVWHGLSGWPLMCSVRWADVRGSRESV